MDPESQHYLYNADPMDPDKVRKPGLETDRDTHGSLE